ncbi:MAG: triose-phosphate isomerase [Kiloniellales bacterium]
MRKLIAGNWKMNGLLADALALAGALLERAEQAPDLACDLLVCPPAQLLHPVGQHLKGGPVKLGGQDCHTKVSGAHTGDISAAMLADVGCSHVIVGHSERRQDHGEDDATVRAKATAARAAGLVPIVCVGETEAERAAGETLAVIERQVRGSIPTDNDGAALVVAYEPVWAIGTGRTATPADVAEAHTNIRRLLWELLGEATGSGVRILYGGSVKPDNAGELLAVANVDGALVGGASLKAADFWAIATASA